MSTYSVGHTIIVFDGSTTNSIATRKTVVFWRVPCIRHALFVLPLADGLLFVCLCFRERPSFDHMHDSIGTGAEGDGTTRQEQETSGTVLDWGRSRTSRHRGVFGEQLLMQQHPARARCGTLARPSAGREGP